MEPIVFGSNYTGIENSASKPVANLLFFFLKKKKKEKKKILRTNKGSADRAEAHIIVGK